MGVKGMGDDRLFDKAVDLACEAMNGAVQQDHDAVHVALNGLGELQMRHQSTLPIQAALQAWADMYVQYVQPPRVEGEPIRLGIMDFATGKVLDVNEADPAARWAGRWVVARGTLDHDMCQALWGDLQERDPKDYKDCIGALLTCVAMCIKAKRDGTFPEVAL